jgi:hypothetical protein
MANFGALTDHFNLAASIGTLVESSKTPIANSRADALDENGDIADAAWYGNTDGVLYEASCTYQVDTNDVNVATALKLGELATGVVVTSIEISTSNGDWPKITVSGILGTGALEQGKTYAMPTATVAAKMQAQAMGITVTTGKLTSCSLSASCDLATANDGEGEPVAHGVSGAVATATAEAVATSTDTPVLAAAEGWEVATGSGLNEPQANWHTTSISVEKVLPVTIAAPAE